MVAKRSDSSLTGCLLTPILLLKTMRLVPFLLLDEINASMKKLLLLVAVAIVSCFTLAPAAVAADLALGAKVFSANCAACHVGGGNVVSANKNLKQETLKQFGMDSADAIVNQVKNGKAAMPAFKARLNEEQIEAVAAYVLDQSTKGWK